MRKTNILIPSCLPFGIRISKLMRKQSKASELSRSEARLPGAERAFKRLLVRVSKAVSKITQLVPFSMYNWNKDTTISYRIK